MTLLLGLDGLRDDDGGRGGTVSRSTPVLGWFEAIKPGCDGEVVRRPACGRSTGSADAAQCKQDFGAAHCDVLRCAQGNEKGFPEALVILLQQSCILGESYTC